jgi:hypothetical protein
VYWVEAEKTGHNPKTGEATVTLRRRLFTDFRLPVKDAYAAAIAGLLDGRPFPSMPLWPPERIVSGGQTGADRAALDRAMAHGIAHGGWCPRGRRAEDSTLDACYELRETDARSYRERTRRNVIDSDGTLVLNLGELDGGTLQTLRIAEQLGKSYRLVPLDSGVREDDVREVRRWMSEHGIATLNVAGPRESKRPGIYGLTQAFLDAVQNLQA